MMDNDFTRARLRLITVYLLIIAGVIGLFSFFVIREADDRQNSASAPAETSPLLTLEAVRFEARRLVPEKEVTAEEYEIENGVLYYTVEFENETDVKGNLVTGRVVVEPDREPSLVEMLTDDFDEMVIWIGLLVFFLAALLSIYVANRTLRPIAENLRKQKQFVSGAAHELRNPLAALHARIEAALRSPQHEASTEVLDDLLSETKRLIALSEELLVIERDEQRARSPKLHSMGTAVDSVLTRLHPLIEEKNIVVTKEIAPDPIFIDGGDLETILYNLVHNAVKFSRESGAVRIVWREGILTIANKGAGISEEALPYIFDRFYTTGSVESGMGLGLSLVQEVVRRYAGTIQATSTPGTWTEFCITF